MAENKPDVLLVGHLCLDIIPKFAVGGSSIADILVPGKLIDIDGMYISNGGSANNTGQAMHRLGFPVRIVGKLAEDFIGRAILDNLRTLSENLVGDMIISATEGSSFTVILNPPGIDRVFLHYAGTNASFVADDLPEASLDGPRLAHFGYPPLMTSFFQNGGVETEKILRRLKGRGLTTSLDMARPDPDAPSGQVDWQSLLDRALPHTDIFLPSIDEIIFMYDRPLFDQAVAKGGNIANHIGGLATLRSLAKRLLSLGPAVVGFKLGDQGFYLLTTADRKRLADTGMAAPANLEAWLGRELIVPCFQAKVVGTTGSGDATIGGFLGGLLKGLTPEAAAVMAVATGGESVEALDSASGVQPWDSVCQRIAAGWPASPSSLIPASWQRDPSGVYQPS
ncbi:MAG: carbohydrate kinase family protein [Planctomycetota bacterium]|jgi:sugar/nucleoside kinase (ribokinase family)|nr:carbohydrate kinase family protein [Planctomycetota bacterium]